jgi:DNA topoisomerase-1
VRFHFRAKSGVTQDIELNDPAMAAIVEKCRKLPGRTLFQYLDSDGRPQCIDSVAVNSYLRGVTGQPFTAKTFRTWSATVLAARAVCDLPAATSDAAFKRHIVRAIDSVAAKLGNTRAVCRSSYIHPGVFDAYRDGVTIQEMQRKEPRRRTSRATKPRCWHCSSEGRRGEGKRLEGSRFRVRRTNRNAEPRNPVLNS